MDIKEANGFMAKGQMTYVLEDIKTLLKTQNEAIKKKKLRKNRITNHN